jgi:gliding motility-associated-like protein
MVVALQDTAYTTVTVNPLPEFTLGKDTTLCNYDSIHLTSGLNTSLINEYQWQDGASIANYLAKPPHGQLNPIWLEVTDTNGCTFRDSISISWQTPPVLELIKDTLICEGGQAQLESDVRDGVGNRINSSDYNLTWQSNPTLTITSDSTAIATPSVVAPPNNSVAYYATVDDGRCTGNTDSVIVTINPNPVVNLTPKEDSICKDLSITLTANESGLGNTRSFIWTVNGTPQPPTTSQQLTQIVTQNTEIVVQSFRDPCYSNTDTAFITVDTTTVRANFNVNPTEGFTTFKPLVMNLSGGAEYFEWDFDNGQLMQRSLLEDQGQIGSYYPEYPLAGTYDIKLVAKRNSGCTDSTTRRIVVTKKFILHIPTAFSPNGDNLNDTWNIVTSDGVLMTGKIYNRWGEQVYEWTKGDTDSQLMWDGVYKNQPLPTGVYTYVLTLTEADKTRHYETGNIHLVR